MKLFREMTNQISTFRQWSKDFSKSDWMKSKQFLVYSSDWLFVWMNWILFHQAFWSPHSSLHEKIILHNPIIEITNLLFPGTISYFIQNLVIPMMKEQEQVIKCFWNLRGETVKVLFEFKLIWRIIFMLTSHKSEEMIRLFLLIMLIMDLSIRLTLVEAFNKSKISSINR